MEILQSVQNRIYEIRGVRVILDKDIAFLYDVDTRVLNQAVKRNLERFPEDFMFQLTKEEVQSINLQKQYLQDLSSNLRSQIVTSSLTEWGGNRYLPYAFTEQGVAMLSGVIHSKKAIEMNIAIMRAFVEIRKWMMQKDEVKHQLNEIKSKLGLHDKQLNEIYEVIENILDKEAAKR